MRSLTVLMITSAFHKSSNGNPAANLTPETFKKIPTIQ